MWKSEHRVVADRGGLRYPSDLANAEWAIVGAMIPPARHGGRRRSVDDVVGHPADVQDRDGNPSLGSRLRTLRHIAMIRIMLRRLASNASS